MRSAGKRMIGAQLSMAIHMAVDEWLRQNPRKSVSDFILEACMEKLDAAKITYDREAALFDGRRRRPGNTPYPPHRPDYHILNANASEDSSPLSAAQSRLVKAAAAKNTAKK